MSEIIRRRSRLNLLLLAATLLGASAGLFFVNISASAQSPNREYLWYEAENMRGFATQPNGEPILNPSWSNPPKAKTPGWGMNGPGVSAE